MKGRGFDSWRSVGLVTQAIQIHATRGVDEVCLLDVSATLEGRGPNLELVRELSEFLFAPLTVGGGIRSIGDVRELLRAGADKVVIGTHYEVIGTAAEIVGRQAIVASLDVRGSGLNGQVYTRSGRFKATGPGPVRWAIDLAQAGAGEILLQSIERDGTGQGYDLKLIAAVSQAVGIPVIASGGCGSYEHMRQALEAGAVAVAAGAFFQFEHATPRGAAQYLADKGIEVRL